MTGLPSDRRKRSGLLLVVLLRVALIGLLLLALTHQDWERFADKAMAARAATYPLAALVVPVIYLLRRGRYPYDVDALLMLPFIVDVGGNALNLYDSISWFDDACHFGNWAMLGGAIGCALRRTSLPPLAVAGLVAGLGAALAILWELVEYQSFLLKTDEVVTIYRDTLGDEVLGLAGATTAGLLVAWVMARGQTTRRPSLSRR
jgi:hypothetical protein